MSDITVSEIMFAVCEYYGVTPQQIRSKTRKMPITRHRQMICYLSKLLTDASYPAIAKQVGRSDHSTILHARRTIDNLLSRDKELRDDADYLVASLTGLVPDNDNDFFDIEEMLRAVREERERRTAMRKQVIREQRIARARKYLEVRQQREFDRRMNAMDDMDAISWRVAQYTKQPLRERLA